MNVNDFYKYLINPQLLNKSTLDELNEVIERYPYFQLARMLYLKNLYLLNDDRYQQTLEKYSIYFSNRKALFDFIHDKKNTDNPLPTDITNASPNTQNNELENTTFDSSKTLVNSQKIIEPLSTSVIEAKSTNNTETEINKGSENIQETQNIESFANKQAKTNVSIADLILQKIESQKKDIADKEKQTNKQSIEKNLTDTTDNAFTFQEWLNRISELENTQKQTNHFTSDNLIENFLQNMHQIERIIPPQNPNVENKDLTENLLPPEEIDLVSEQLAQLYYKQGHLERALKMYEKLFLKYPEKSIYFANLIQEIKQKLDKN